MPSRVWLAAAFVIAFGASPAQAGMQTAAGKLLDVHPAKTVAALQNRFPASILRLQTRWRVGGRD